MPRRNNYSKEEINKIWGEFRTACNRRSWISAASRYRTLLGAGEQGARSYFLRAQFGEQGELLRKLCERRQGKVTLEDHHHFKVQSLATGKVIEFWVDVRWIGSIYTCVDGEYKHALQCQLTLPTDGIMRLDVYRIFEDNPDAKALVGVVNEVYNAGREGRALNGIKFIL